MLLPEFEYHEPETLEQACQVLASYGPQAKPLAGGTDLIVNMKKGLLAPDHVVSLGRIEELRRIDVQDSTVSIGASVTAAELAASPEIQARLAAVAQGAGSLGSPLIRNLATAGGNLATARPAADLPPPLMAYGARVVLRGPAGERTLALEEFFKGPGETAIGPEEILVRICVERLPRPAGAAYLKLGQRRALEISLVNVAAFLSLDAGTGAIETARLVLGAVAPTPIRAHSAEKVLTGEKPGEGLFEHAGKAAAGDSRPIDDYRGSGEYRQDMVAVLAKRALAAALEQARAA